MDRLKHILSGGYWKQEDEWVQAGSRVRRVLLEEPIIQRHLGWAPPRKNTPGVIRVAGHKKAPPCTWPETQASQHTCAENLAINAIHPDVTWRQGLSVVAQSGDVCPKNGWVFAQTDQMR